MELPYVFISYQTRDRQVAARVQRMLKKYGLTTFTAHEDIEVSIPWRDKILEELGKADIFMCLLSRNYSQSPWCQQEAGIACFRRVHIIPLSLDGAIPEGFIATIQSKKIDVKSEIELDDFIDGFKAYDPALVIAMLTARLRQANTRRKAEQYLKPLAALAEHMTDAQGQEALDVCFENPHIHHQDDCAAVHIPRLLKRFGHMIKPAKAAFLRDHEHPIKP